ncbi:MAG: MMPL family transporter [Rothia sp. (in: high G+C Gram-positive bacteria)]|nr:MMPL family transporter [Rothia sp. (in: high G+C Gram-positive bacteria)]
MSKLLYQLGGFAARRSWVIIGIWALILAALAGSYTAFKGEMTNNITIPGTEAQLVQEELADTFGINTNAATGSAIVQTEDGSAFSDEQKAALASALTTVGESDAVESTSNPFEIAQQLTDARQQIEDGRAQLQEGQTELDAAQAQLDSTRQMLESVPQAPASAWDELNTGQAQADAGRTQLEANRTQLEDKAALLDMTSSAAAISEDGSTAIAAVTFKDELPALNPDDLQKVRDELSILETSGLKVTFDQNMQGAETHMDVTAEIIGIAIAFIILFVMLGTLIAAGLPILLALVGVGSSVMGTLALSSLVDMTTTTPMLGTMLGLAVGIDYTLFILNRHRNNLAQGMGMVPSIALATGTSGGAVVFAGITVIIALLGLNVVGIPFLSTMGNAAAFAVFLAVAVSVTLTPAVLSLVGWKLLPKKRRAALQARAELLAQEDPTDAEVARTRAEAHKVAEQKLTKQSGWLGVALKKPIITIAAAALALGTLSLPASDMRLGLPDGSSQPASSAAYISYNLIADTFGEGKNGTVIAAARLPEGTTAEQADALQVEIGKQITQQDAVVSVLPAKVADDSSAILYQVVPSEGPSSESTARLVHNLRALTVETEQGTVNFGVTGQTAMNVDISENLYKVLPIYVGIVIGLSLIILVLVFRSIVVPVTATIGFLFSLLAALGATVAVFQWGWAGFLFGVSTPGPLLAFLPILAVGILFGLAMDYQLFMVSGMKEAHSHGYSAKDAVVIGYKQGAKVVTAAALIMAGVFIGFVFSGEPMIASIGFVLAAGVLFDAFVVRMTLIPALMHLLGERAWYLPSWLDRLLPDLDVEGTKLEAELERTQG